jgi:hypothetical protein
MKTVADPVAAWGRIVVGVGVVWFVVGVPAFFIWEKTPITLENVFAITAYGLVSLGWWGAIVFVIGAIPIAAISWLVRRLRGTKRETL